MLDFVERRVRGMVADHLGVEPGDLSPDVSLTDNLAADSLDLCELALLLEGEFGITLPDADFDGVRTFGDLVGLVNALTSTRAEVPDGAGAAPPALVWARIVPAPGIPRGDLQYTGWLTPYTTQTIIEDVLRTGRGARLELNLPTSLPEASLARVRDQFAWLGQRGVEVSIQREDRPGRGLHPAA